MYTDKQNNKAITIKLINFKLYLKLNVSISNKIKLNEKESIQAANRK